MNLDRGLMVIAGALFVAALVAGGGPVTAIGLVTGMAIAVFCAWRYGRSGKGAQWTDGGGPMPYINAGIDADDGGHHGAGGHQGHGGIGGGHFGGGGHVGGGGGGHH